MKIAYCQISAHQSFVGAYGTYCKEPIIDKYGALLTKLDYQPIKYICEKIEEKYNYITKNKLKQILKSLSGKGIECLVFPEYSIPATSLELLYNFSQIEKCMCIAASHSIQGIYDEIYKSINLDINLDKDLGLSCCPIILPSNHTIPVFKKYKSKWESNMNTDDDEYSSSKGLVYIPYDGKQQIAVVVCIDALKIDVDPSKAKLLIVPAATPSTGQFRNKFESYLSRDLPTVFCNHYQGGGSTIYCHVPSESNTPFADSTKFIQLGAFEEVIVIASIDINNHTLSVKTANTRCLGFIDNIIPIYYRDKTNSLALMDKISTTIKNQDFFELTELINLLYVKDNGLLIKYKSYLQENIQNRSMSFEKISFWLQYIYINEFSLQQYERNWVEKTLDLIQRDLMGGALPVTEEVLQVQKRLYEANSSFIKQGIDKYDLPVFDDSTNEDANFQNRGGEIQQFKTTFQETEKSMFVMNGFTSTGKSALIKRLKYLYSFNTQEITLPKSSGFETLLRVFLDITKLPISWDMLDSAEIKMLATQVSQKICLINKTIIVIKNIGNIFDDYNIKRTIMFLNHLADELTRQRTHIKVIIEIFRTIPKDLTLNENIYICRLKPLLPLYIERLIEQIATKVTYTLSLPVIPKEVIAACNGNPGIAELIGIYLGKKINNKNEISLTLNEISNFTNKHVDGILENLQISESEKAFVQDISIFRIPVRKLAYENFKSYKKEIILKLVENMIIENNEDFYSVNRLVYSRYNRISELSYELHKIAAEYHDSEFKSKHNSIDKAEYFYHISFCDPSLRKSELRYYSDDVLSAAIRLADDARHRDTKRIEIALSHLDSIKHWKNRYWKYNLYVAYCKVLLDDYAGYQDAFDNAVELKNGNKEIVYFLMSNKLIKARKQIEAENLLNIIEDLFGRSKQLSALWVMLRYSNNTTKKQAIDSALEITKAGQYDIYASKILVRIYLQEGLKNEALEELDTVTKVWSNNDWAKGIRYRIKLGIYDIEDDGVGIDDEGQD